MNRNKRAEMAAETLAILRSGAYASHAGTEVSIRDSLDTACANTVLYTPEQQDAVLERLATCPSPSARTIIEVSNSTTLEAASSLKAEHAHVAALNFASAKNPGGGFLSGSQAQEESLARSSGLYATLETQPDYYAFHRQQTTCLYSDRVIFSHEVPVFRDDSGRLLDEPWTVSFLTCAAVNAGAVRRNEPAEAGKIEEVMQRRTRYVLTFAALHGCDALVLGAWGCGVFQNDPATIAGVFAKVLMEPLFQGRFDRVDFAIYDPSLEGATYKVFKQQFG